MKTAKEFNEKYKDYLLENQDGLTIENKYVIKYLDSAFKLLIQKPNFKYSQIKLKYGLCSFYCQGIDSSLIELLESDIDILIETENTLKIKYK